jgi:hypothetical protein
MANSDWVKEGLLIALTFEEKPVNTRQKQP